ncbi:hypothetical protein GCM10020256_16810 [Streptomyces thermocoprophilus]
MGGAAEDDHAAYPEATDRLGLLRQGGGVPGGRGGVHGQQVLAADQDGAGLGREGPVQAAQQRGLARSVGADDTEHLAGLGPQVDAVQDGYPGQAGAEPADGQIG